MVEAETPHNDWDSGLYGPPPAACRPPIIFGPPQAVATVTTQPNNGWPWFCLVDVKKTGERRLQRAAWLEALLNMAKLGRLAVITEPLLSFQHETWGCWG